MVQATYRCTPDDPRDCRGIGVGKQPAPGRAAAVTVRESALTTSHQRRPDVAPQTDPTRSPTTTTITLRPVPASASAARRFVRAALTGADHGPPSAELLDDALLIVSELVTNAVLHAGTDVVVAVSCLRDSWHIEVRDSSTDHRLLPRPESTTATGGRGLALVDAYARSWGVERHPSGKSVWFDLGAHQP